MRNVIPFLLTLTTLAVEAQEASRLSLLFVGDIMQHDSQINGAYDPVRNRYCYAPCFQYVRPYIESADIAIGNLELTLGGPPYKGYPQFSAPDALSEALLEAGFDILVTANNHSADRGSAGLERTINVLDTVGLRHTGTFADTVVRLNEYPMMVRRNGITLALLNYTFSTNGLPVTKPNVVNRIDTAVIRYDLEKALRDSADFCIVFMHWGNEYEQTPSKSQRLLANFCFEHGARLVVGSHPHVIQPMIWDREHDRLVAYSLGNFVSGQRKRYTDGGAVLQVSISKGGPEKEAGVVIDSAAYLLTWVYRSAGPTYKYSILPAGLADRDTAIIADKMSRTALAGFLSDSRSFFQRENMGVGECLDGFVYRVVLPDTICVQADTLAPSDPMPCYEGTFASEREALDYLEEKGVPGARVEAVRVR